MPNSDYSLENLKKTDEEMRMYAKMVMSLVKEIDRRPIEVEVNRIKSHYHIDHYFIQNKGKKIGVVKVFQGTFYYLGLEDSIQEDDFKKIISLIENNLGGWRITKFEAQVHTRYVDTMREMGYELEFSRFKMVLKLAEAKHLSSEFPNIKRTFQRSDLRSIIDMATDAYRYSIDEKVGIFSPGMASTEIPAILNGKYGEFRPDLTPVIVSEGSNYIEGACLTSIADEQPFIVLIGVRRSEQGVGYGRELLSWVIKQVIDEGYSELQLWVTSGNTIAIKLYESMGFNRISSIFYMHRYL